MEKIIVFGASTGGKYYIENQRQYEVLAVVDNDSSKHGKQLKDGVFIISPEEITEYPFDRIVIASMYIDGITEQLTEKIGIDRRQIEYAPKRLMKTNICSFEDEATVTFAKQVLFDLTAFLTEKKYTYFLNFGTLLGIVRENRLLPWDDDIDIAVLNKDVNLQRFSEEIQRFFSRYAEHKVYQMKVDSEGELAGIDVAIESDKILPFAISVDLAKERGEHMYLPIDKIDASFFKKQDIVQFDQVDLFAPSPHEEYLTYVYNDWKTVKKDVSFMDNTTTYNEPSSLKIQTIE